MGTNLKQKKKTARKPAIIPFHISRWAIVLFLLGFLLYGNTIGHKFVLDDYGVMKDNWLVKRGIDAIPTILSTPYRYGVGMFSDNLYRPLSLVMFATEWEISPNSPELSHFINVFLYALSGALLLLALHALLKGRHPWLALFAALLWLAHPVHTEVVANIKSRDEILSLLFLLLTLLAFIRYLEQGKPWMLALAVLTYFIAILSKEGVVTFIPLFPLAGWLFIKAPLRRNLMSSALLVLPVIAYLLLRQAIISQYAVPSVTPVVDNLLMAAPSFAEKSATAISILGKYLLLLIVPYQLVSDYSFNQIPVVGWSSPVALLSLLIYAAGLVWAVFAIRKYSVPAFAILLYLFAMSLYSNLFYMIGTSFAERLLYLPSLGFCLALAWSILRLLHPVPENTPWHGEKETYRKYILSCIVLGIIILLYGIRTITRAAEWKDQWTLFSADINRSPKSAHLHYYWGLTLRDRAKEQTDKAKYDSLMRAAVHEFQIGVTIYPAYPECYHQLGLAWFRLEDINKALEYYSEAIRLNPLEAVPYANMGIIYFNRGNYQKARELYEKSISIDPRYADGHFNLGSTLGMLGEFNKAIEQFRLAIEYDPEHTMAWYFLGKTYERMNNKTEATRCLERAYQLNPELRK
jgi:tetratricopeptide (TPR) repeat protein